MGEEFGHGTSKPASAGLEWITSLNRIHSGKGVYLYADSLGPHRKCVLLMQGWSGHLTGFIVV